MAKSYGVFFCDEEKDCELDECCVVANTAQLLGKGVCRKFERAGTQCSEPDAALEYFGNKYLFRCPCKVGTDCEPTGTCRSGSCNLYMTFASQRCLRRL
ncbi:hypothetical protein JTE90_009893 [Oedothorax gibbosus]|uniref:Prokineticin domain-containing protein n=1 Tax=Oedothorax gibbosus TaxID=931172 RepID=A0AAV6UVZ3_9ARAC|nr:hypothetical protein JTE90_009893 [Oedothorax gibbosus]